MIVLAVVLAAIVSARTEATRRFKDPGTLTLDELTALGCGLHIPIEELRAAIRY